MNTVRPLLIAAVLLGAGCDHSDSLGPLGPHDSFDPPDQDGCDAYYKAGGWWTIAWDDQPEGAWESPAEALERLGRAHSYEVQWTSTSVDEAPWLGTMTQWELRLDRHATRPPVWAVSEEPACPPVLVLPLAVTLWSVDGRVWLEDQGAQWSDDWEDDIWFFPWESNMSIGRVFGDTYYLSVDMVPGKGDQAEWTPEIQEWMDEDAASHDCVDPELLASVYENDNLQTVYLDYRADPTFGSKDAVFYSGIGMGQSWDESEVSP